MQQLLARPRVDAVLREAVDGATLTILQAPLGAGKSSATTTAFANAHAVVQLQAEAWHRGAFAAALVEAVREARPEFGRLTLGAIEAGASATHVGATFAQDLGHVDEPILLIVDNVHVFKGEGSFARFIEAAMRGAPPNFRALALGRSIPELTLGESAMRGRVRLLDGAFLAFDADDVRALAAAMGRAVGGMDVERILSWTEGWGAGVALALSAQDLTEPGGFAPRAWAERFLNKHLLRSLTPETVAFLEDSSVFDVIDASLFDPTTTRAFHMAMDELRRAGALVSEVRPGNFRIHPLLREVAESRLETRGALPAAHARAALAYSARGSMGAALFHAAASDDISTSATILREHADGAIATGDHATLRLLVAGIDPQGRDGDIRFYVEALLQKANGSKETGAALERAVAAAREQGDDALYFDARAQLMQFDLGRSLRGNGETLSELAARAELLGDRARATAAMLQGWTSAVAHDFSGALSAIASIAGIDDPDAAFNCSILRAYAQTAQGDFDAAERTLEGLVRTLEAQDRAVMQVLALIWFARLSLVAGRTTTAMDAGAQAQRLASRLDLRSEEAALYCALSEIATHAGNVDGAVSGAERAKRRSELAWYGTDVGRVAAFSEIALARAAFLGHDNAIARDLALRAASSAPPVQRAQALAEAAVYTLLCDPSSGEALVNEARTAIADAAPVDAADAVALAVADDILAFLDAANGDAHATVKPRNAFATLIANRRGLVTLEHAGIAAAKLRRGDGGAEAFEMALAQITRDGPRFETRLARAYVATFVKSKSAERAPAATFDLTAREHEILALLVEGLSNKEIAQRLIVSPRTIETHVERVLGKLEVGSRSRAIAKALRLGLVELT